MFTFTSRVEAALGGGGRVDDIWIGATDQPTENVIGMDDGMKLA